MIAIDLSGRTALITGGTRGIGLEIASSLVRAGAKVAIAGRDADRAAQAAASIGGGTQGFTADLGQAGDAQRLVEHVEGAFGSLDILVNNAGLTRDNILVRLKDEDWDAVIDTNLRPGRSSSPTTSGTTSRRSTTRARWT